MKNKEVEDKIVKYVSENTKTKDEYWYPMDELKKEIPVIAYNLEKIYNDNNINQLEKVFKKIKAKKVDTFSMDNKEYFENDIIYNLIYEKDNNNNYVFPKYVETYYFDKTYKWMTYVSHEGTITFTGKNIVNIAKKTLPKKYLYKE